MGVHVCVCDFHRHPYNTLALLCECVIRKLDKTDSTDLTSANFALREPMKTLRLFFCLTKWLLTIVASIIIMYLIL